MGFLALGDSRSLRSLVVIVSLGVCAAIAVGIAAAPGLAPATVSVTRPEVHLRRDGASAYFLARDGDPLRGGDAVRTDSTGSAVITYFDGSTVTLAPDTEILIERLEVDSAGRVVVLMLQTAGRAWYAITSALSPNSRYEVRTVATAAVVRAGSVAEVEVDASGEATVTAVSGTVTTTRTSSRTSTTTTTSTDSTSSTTTSSTDSTRSTSSTDSTTATPAPSAVALKPRPSSSTDSASTRSFVPRFQLPALPEWAKGRATRPHPPAPRGPRGGGDVVPWASADAGASLL